MDRQVFIIEKEHVSSLLQVEQTLPLDEERQTYVASLTSPHTGVTSLPCIITG